MIEYSISEDIKLELRRRSSFLKKIVEFYERNNYESAVILIKLGLESLSEDDDPYFKCYLYSIIIRIYIEQEDSISVITYTNKILIESGMVLNEYVGKYSPFAPDVIEKVIEIYEKVINQKKSGEIDSEIIVQAYWGKARIFHLKNNWNEAHRLYEEALKLNPNDTMTLRMHGRLYEDECKFSEALALYNRIAELNTDKHIHCFIANIYMKLNNNEYAKELLENSLKVYPNDTITLYRLCNLYLFLKQQNEYEAIRKRLLALCPYNTKYYLYTSNCEQNNSEILYEEIIETMQDEVDYSVAYRFYGDYYFYKQDYKKALEYFELQVNNSPFSQNTYENIFKTIYRLHIFNSDIGELSNKYMDYIKKIKKIFPYDEVFYLKYDLLNKSLDTVIELYEEKRPDYLKNFEFNFSLLGLYKEKKDVKKITSLIKEMKLIYSESFSVYIEDYFLNWKEKNYRKIRTDLLKLKQISTINISPKKSNKIYDDLLVLDKFYINPDDYITLKEKNIKKLTNESYKDLLIFYFNKCYSNNESYINYAYNCVKQLDLDAENDMDIIYIASLVLYVNNEKELAQKYFDKYYKNNTDKYMLLKMIDVVGDIFNISILKDLYINSSVDENNSSKEMKELDIYIYALLYLLHYTYIKNEDYKKEISHYTSVSVLSYLLDENQMSKLRLSSIKTANDPKEGSVLLDYLCLNIKDITRIKKIKELVLKNNYALQTSFTLLQDALTMFRLYGKRDNLEGTGVNIVFNSNFFSQDLKPPLEMHDKEKLQNRNNDIENTESNLSSIIENRHLKKLPLYFVLYYDRKNNKLVFNPFNIYEGSVLDLKKEVSWNVINQNNDQVKEFNKEAYLNNIIFVFQQLQRIFKKIPIDELKIAKTKLLEIDYLVKDIAFVDEKELRMIKILSNNESKYILHDKDKYNLYYDYMDLLGMNHFCTNKMINKIILGPKVQQVNSIKEYIINHLNLIGLGDVDVLISEAPLA